MQARRFDYAILALGVCAVSTAALMIREAAAPAMVISAYRLSLASLPLLLLTRLQRQPLIGSNRVRLLLTVLAGIFLAAHFLVWTESVQRTSIATSVFLVTTCPLFVALASGPLLGERPTLAVWLGIAISCAGIALMVSDDLGAGSDTLLGDFYALLGAIFAAGYLMAGRRLQVQGQSWLSYVAIAYSVGALVLVITAVAVGEHLAGFSTRTYLLLAGLAFIPQLIGHTAINRSLGYLPAVAVSIAIMGEPVVSTLLAIVLLNEDPTALEIGGGLLVLAGVYVGLRAPATKATPVALP